MCKDEVKMLISSILDSALSDLELVREQFKHVDCIDCDKEEAIVLATQIYNFISTIKVCDE